MKICLFCAAQTSVDPSYHEAAREFGRGLAERGHELYYGGGSIGLMGTAARAVHEVGGRVVGVIPARLRKKEVAYEEADEMIVTAGMSDRKEILVRESDAFIVLPGGFGTLDELLDVITTKQLGFHDKPIIVVNVNGFFDQLLKMFAHIVEARFADNARMSYFTVASTVPEALTLLEDELRRDGSERW